MFALKNVMDYHKSDAGCYNVRIVCCLMSVPSYNVYSLFTRNGVSKLAKGVVGRR